MSNRRTITEYARGAGPLEVDAEGGVIRGVRVLGLVSQNGRRYLPEAVRAALSMYDGVVVNCDHPTRPGEQIPADRRIGWLTSPRLDPDGGVRADLHLLKSHPMSGRVIEAAQRRPELFGLSHNSTGRVERRDGEEVVVEILGVESVDLVADPATTRGLHESRSHTMKKTVRDLIESLKTKRPGYARGLKEMAAAGVMSDTYEMDEPGEMSPAPAEAADHETALKAGFKAAVNAVLDDDSIATVDKLKKIKDILASWDKLLAAPAMEEMDEEEGEEETEEPKAEGRIKRLQLQLKARDLLMESGVRPNPVLSKALDACKTEQEIREVIEAARTTTVGTGARSAPGQRVQESKTADQPPAEGKALANWIKAGV